MARTPLQEATGDLLEQLRRGDGAGRCRECGDATVLDVRDDGDASIAAWCTSCGERRGLDGGMGGTEAATRAFASHPRRVLVAAPTVNLAVIALVLVPFAAMIAGVGEWQHRDSTAFLATAVPASGTVVDQWEETRTDAEGRITREDHVRVEFQDDEGSVRELEGRGSQSIGASVDVLYSATDPSDARLAFTEAGADRTYAIVLAIAAAIALAALVLMGMHLHRRGARRRELARLDALRRSGRAASGILAAVVTTSIPGRPGPQHVLVARWAGTDGAGALAASLPRAVDPRPGLRSGMSLQVLPADGDDDGALVDDGCDAQLAGSMGQPA